MIQRVYSITNPKKLLNIIYHQEVTRGTLAKIERTEISGSKDFLQAMHIKLPSGTEIKPHAHKPIKRKTTKTQECLLVLEGSIELTIFDTNKKTVQKEILNRGDCTLFLDGGHSFKVVKHASVFEFKNGPYLGPEKDKIPI